MKPKFIAALALLAGIHFGCAEKKDGLSPQFKPGTIVSVFGKFVDETGSPLADKHIHLQNLREFAYIDYGSPDPAKITRNYFGIFFNALFFPFFPKYRYDENVYNKKTFRPDSLQTTLNTNQAGEFKFEIQADRFLRDAQQAINISITNEEIVSGAFGRAAFIITAEDNDLGTITLCNNQVEVKEEGDNSVTFSFEPPLFEVNSYIVNFGDAETNALVWSQILPAGQTTLNLPDIIFGSQKIRVSYEAYSVFLEDKKISCLAAPVEFQIANPKASLVAGALASSPSVMFKINSLTNGSFDDPIYLEALNSDTLTFNLAQPIEASKIIIHNLLMTGSGQITLKVNSEIYSIDAKRFFVVDLDRTTTVNSIEFYAPATIIDLKEVTVH